MLLLLVIQRTDQDDKPWLAVPKRQTLQQHPLQLLLLLAAQSEHNLRHFTAVPVQDETGAQSCSNTCPSGSSVLAGTSLKVVACQFLPWAHEAVTPCLQILVETPPQ